MISISKYINEGWEWDPMWKGEGSFTDKLTKGVKGGIDTLQNKWKNSKPYDLIKNPRPFKVTPRTGPSFIEKIGDFKNRMIDAAPENAERERQLALTIAKERERGIDSTKLQNQQTSSFLANMDRSDPEEIERKKTFAINLAKEREQRPNSFLVSR